MISQSYHILAELLTFQKHLGLYSRLRQGILVLLTENLANKWNVPLSLRLMSKIIKTQDAMESPDAQGKRFTALLRLRPSLMDLCLNSTRR